MREAALFALGHVELSIRHDLVGRNGRRAGDIEGLYVQSETRGHGIVLAPLRAAERWARQQACVAFASDRDDRLTVFRGFQAGED